MSTERAHSADLADRYPDVADAEPNGTEALKPLYELDADASTRVVDWIIADQEDAETKPTVDDVVESIEQAENVGLMFSGSSGVALVKPTENERYLHWKYITDDEKVRAVADVERRDPDDVRITKAEIDEATLRNWIHLAIDTGRLKIAAVDDLSVFDDPDSFRQGGRK